jgi:DNA-binding NarL/FixJ family response regulator
MRKSRILVVDDHPIVRQGLVKLIEQEPDLAICGEAEDARQALQRLSRSKADLAIVDLSLKGGSGLELVKSIRARFPRLRVLVLSMHEESLFAERVLKAGGSGYIMKQEAPARVVTAIRRVLGGDIYVSDEVAGRMVRSFARGGPPEDGSPLTLLSDRELEVFQLLGEGLGTRQVAEALHLSVKTIETYRQRIKEKLALKSAAELVHRAIEWAPERPRRRPR